MKNFILIAVIIQIIGCSSRSQDIYFNVDNPRKVGETLFVSMKNGKPSGYESSPSSDTTTVVNYTYNMCIISELKNGNLVKPDIYGTRLGTFDNPVYTKIPQAHVIGLSSISRLIIDYQSDVRLYVLLIRGELEKTGVRVFRVNPTTMRDATHANPIPIPDLLTLPLLSDDPDSKRLEQIYNSTIQTDETYGLPP